MAEPANSIRTPVARVAAELAVISGARSTWKAAIQGVTQRPKQLNVIPTTTAWKTMATARTFQPCRHGVRIGRFLPAGFTPA